MRKKILELIKVMRRNLLDPLPKTPGQRKKLEAAKRALDMAELAVKVGKAPAAFLYALEYADFAYDAKNKDLIDAAKNPVLTSSFEFGKLKRFSSSSFQGLSALKVMLFLLI